jgi:outer membrane protein assembly factor BamB
MTPQAPYQPTVHTGPLPVGRPARGRGALSAAVSVAVAIAVVVAIAISQFDWDGLTGDFSAGDLIDGVEGLGDTGLDDTGPALSLVHEQQLSGTGASAVVAAGDMAILAEVDAGLTTVHAVGPGGEPLWEQSYELEPSDLYLTVVSDVLVIDAMASATDEGQNMRAAANLSDGELLWKRPWIDRNDLAYFGHDVIVEQRAGIYDNAVLRIDLTTGEEVWKEQGPESLFIIDEYRARAATVWDDGDRPGVVPPNSYALFDNLAATEQIVDLDPDAGTAVVRDAASGDATAEGDLAIDSERWTVFDDLVIGRASDEASPGRDTLIAYSLSDFGQAWSVPLDVSFTIQEVKACGPHLVCAALDHVDADDQYKTVAYDTATGEQRWEVAVEWSTEDHWYTAPDGLVHGDQVFDVVDTAKVLDFEGGIRLGDGEPITSILAARQGLAVVQEYGGTGFEVAVLDLATGQTSAGVDVGPDLAEHAFLAGDLLVVLTGDKRALVYTVPDLA